MKFNKIEYLILKHAHPDGFGHYNEGPLAQRAKVLVKEGYLKDTNWSEYGWQLTEKGKEYRKKFMEKLQKRHGHIWLTKRESNPGHYRKNDEYGKLRDDFAMSGGNHNGPKCRECGYEFCQHCTCEFDVPECREK